VAQSRCSVRFSFFYEKAYLNFHIHKKKSRRNNSPFHQALQREATNQAICYTANDLLEGLNGVKTKTTPKFSNADDKFKSFKSA